MLYVRVIISGQVPPLETSFTKATTGLIVQLSASSITTAGSGGIAAIHCALTGAGSDAVGFVSSLIVIICVTKIWFPHASVTLYVLVIISGQVLPSDTSFTKATTGFAVQLSASSVTTVMSGAGSAHCTASGAGLLAVGL